MRPLFLIAAMLLVSSALRSAEIKKGPLAPLDDKNKSQNVPGSFHPYNVTERVFHIDELESDKNDRPKDKIGTKYSSKGKYHCLVTEYDLDPVILLFAKGVNDSEGFRDLLKKLDDAIEWRQRRDPKDEKAVPEPKWIADRRAKAKTDGGSMKNRFGRVRAFVVFLDDDKRLDAKDSLVKEDDLRDRLEKDVQKIADDLKLRHVVLTIAARGDLDNDKVKYGIDKDKALTAVLYRALQIRASHDFASGDIDKADAPALEPVLDDIVGKLLPPK